MSILFYLFVTLLHLQAQSLVRHNVIPKIHKYRQNSCAPVSDPEDTLQSTKTPCTRLWVSRQNCELPFPSSSLSSSSSAAPPTLAGEQLPDFQWPTPPLDPQFPKPPPVSPRSAESPYRIMPSHPDPSSTVTLRCSSEPSSLTHRLLHHLHHRFSPDPFLLVAVIPWPSPPLRTSVPLVDLTSPFLLLN